MRLLISCLRMSSKASARPSTSWVLLRQLVSAPSTRSRRRVALPGGRVGRLLVARLGDPGRRVGRLLGRSALRDRIGFLGGSALPAAELQPRQQVARLGHLLDHLLEPLPQHELAGFEHRPQLLGRHHVQQPAFAAGDVGAMAQVAEIGGLDAHEQLLARLQAQFAHLQRRVGQLEIRGAVVGQAGRSGGSLGFCLVDRRIRTTPGPCRNRR